MCGEAYLDGEIFEGDLRRMFNLTHSAIAMLEQMENATGIDVAKLARNATDESSVDLRKKRG